MVFTTISVGSLIMSTLIPGLILSGMFILYVALAARRDQNIMRESILQNLAKSTASEVSWGVLPFLVIIGIFLALISLVPSLTTWLPALVMK
jgi:TRAP-type C4-dicarboxylate transport system permease large subunit